MERLVELGPEDAGEVLTLQRAAYVTEGQAHNDIHLPPLRQTLADLRAELADPESVALGWRNDEGRLLAAVRVRNTSDTAVAEVGRLAVVPDRQGQGLGSQLLIAVEDRLPPTVRELRLFTGEHSATNLRLYARLGYSETSREPTPAGYAVVHLHKPRQGEDTRQQWLV